MVKSDLPEIFRYELFKHKLSFGKEKTCIFVISLYRALHFKEIKIA